MRKHDVLKAIFESPGGITPKQISSKLQISIPNVYTYLKELREERLVQPDKKGAYSANKTNKKLRMLMNIKSMAPDEFHIMVSREFGELLEKACKKIVTKRTDFTQSEMARIKKIALPKRIFLRIPGRRGGYSLKINESIVSELLKYHDLDAAFNRIDFQKFISGLELGSMEAAGSGIESDPDIAKRCEKAYSENTDLFLGKVERFIPDERISALIESADQANREHLLFLNALEDNVRREIEGQWEQRYVYNTNSIEGNTMTERDVQEYLLGGKTPKGVSRREIHETNNMRQALKFVKLKAREGLSEELVKELHFIVQTEIDENPGEYKRLYNHVNNNPTTPPKYVPKRMRELLEWYGQNKGKFHPFVLASAFHIQFEMIHPFRDGNGRVGRLLMNHILKRQGYMPLTIMEKTKQNYYRAIENQSLHQFLLYALTGFIGEYRR